MRVTRWVVGVLSVMSWTCGTRPSSLVIRVDSDLGAAHDPGGRLRAVQIVVRRGFEQHTSAISLLDRAHGLPGDYVVHFAASAEDRRVSVEVVGMTTDPATLRQRWNVEVPSGQTRVLSVFLADACAGRGECGAGQNCGRSGACEDSPGDPLTDYTPLVVRDAGALRDAAEETTCPPPAADVDAGSCWTLPSCRALCPSVGVQAPARWRVTQLQFVLPVGLANEAVTRILRDYIAHGHTLFGIVYESAGMVMHAGPMLVTQPGSTGLGLIDARYRFYRADDRALVPIPNRPQDWVPVVIPLRSEGDHLTSEGTTQTLRIVTRYPGLGPAIFDMANVRIGEFRGSESDECLGAALPSGRQFNECTALWTPESADGAPMLDVEGVLTVAQARAIGVFTEGRSVCAIVAGTTDCDAVPMQNWSNPPDTNLNGEPAWRLRARISAVRANIEDPN